MENIFLVKIQTNVNQWRHIHNNFCQNFLAQLKSRIFTIKIGVIFFCIRIYFSLPGWTGSFIFWVFKCHISGCRFLITRFLHLGFYCIWDSSVIFTKQDCQISLLLLLFSGCVGVGWWEKNYNCLQFINDLNKPWE